MSASPAAADRGRVPRQPQAGTAHARAALHAANARAEVGRHGVRRPALSAVCAATCGLALRAGLDLWFVSMPGRYLPFVIDSLWPIPEV